MKVLKGLFSPRDPERLESLARRSEDLPPQQMVYNQVLGRFSAGCAATHGVYERCNFGCTACYLGPSANQQSAMPFYLVREQLQHLRQTMGPGANIQITSGEVTLLPVDDLTRIVRAVVDLDMSPMVMTHGDELLQEPDYLDQLVLRGGLRKISLHVDTTQRGRKHHSREDLELCLNPVRDRMAAMLRACHKRTGVKLKAATTLTVNRENLDQRPDVFSWFVNHADCFRLISLQPQAQTGRTKRDNGVSADEVMTVMNRWLGRAINPHAFRFGHEDCNRIALFLAVETGDTPILLEAVRADSPEDKRLVARFLKDFAGVVLNDRSPGEITAHLLGILCRKPLWLFHGFRYALIRSWQERRHIPKVVLAALRLKLRFRPLAFVIHAFMDAAELETEKGKARLEACSFKLSVDGQLVPMCQMNGTETRENTYARESVFSR